jgi:outer membrane protein assembly factor BamB
LLPGFDSGRMAEGTPPKTYSFEKLAIWRIELPVADAVLPPHNTRPNPLVRGDKLFVSVFSPGAICCLQRETGRLVWRRPITKYGQASVYASGKSLLAGSSHSVHSLRPDSGEILWSFCPYGPKGEWIYSSPTIHKKRSYVGDRRGYLHCLDSESGMTIWRRLTSHARNNDVNSTPVIAKGLVMVTTNAGIAVAYDVETGELAWKQNLDGPSLFGPLVYRRSLTAMAESLYQLDLRSGNIQQHFEWKSHRPGAAEATPQGLFVALWPHPSSLGPPLDSRIMIKRSGSQLRMITGRWPSLRYSTATGLVYSSHIRGVDVFAPANGALLYKLKITPSRSRRAVALVDVKDGIIYALTGAGQVYALRHP